jgi:hypothetical protein
MEGAAGGKGLRCGGKAAKQLLQGIHERTQRALAADDHRGSPAFDSGCLRSGADRSRAKATLQLLQLRLPILPPKQARSAGVTERARLRRAALLRRSSVRLEALGEQIEPGEG